LARIAVENRCRDIVVLDLGEASPVTDFFVVATGTSARQLRSVVTKMKEFVRDELGEKSPSLEGLASDRWVLLDLFDVVVHVFAPEARDFYALELLWGDVPHIDWQKGYHPPKTKAEVDDQSLPNSPDEDWAEPDDE
jgi:ribosome-associated protein